MSSLLSLGVCNVRFVNLDLKYIHIPNLDQWSPFGHVARLTLSQCISLLDAEWDHYWSHGRIAIGLALYLHEKVEKARPYVVGSVDLRHQREIELWSEDFKKSLAWTNKVIKYVDQSLAPGEPAYIVSREESRLMARLVGVSCLVQAGDSAFDNDEPPSVEGINYLIKA